VSRGKISTGLPDAEREATWLDDCVVSAKSSKERLAGGQAEIGM
jgi:hypothetical protein